MSRNIKILKKAQTGDRKAQMKVYDTYYKSVYNSCYRILLNKEDAEDICHDTFIQVFDNKFFLPDNINSTAWLRRMGINKSIDLLRRQKKIELIGNADDELRFFADNEDYSSFDPKLIYDNIKKLPKQYQLIINLYLIEGYDHKEISEILNISSSTSRSQLSRAKQKLKATLISNKYPTRIFRNIK